MKGSAVGTRKNGCFILLYVSLTQFWLGIFMSFCICWTQYYNCPSLDTISPVLILGSAIAKLRRGSKNAPSYNMATSRFWQVWISWVCSCVLVMGCTASAGAPSIDNGYPVSILDSLVSILDSHSYVSVLIPACQFQYCDSYNMGPRGKFQVFYSKLCLKYLVHDPVFIPGIRYQYWSPSIVTEGIFWNHVSIWGSCYPVLRLDRAVSRLGQLQYRIQHIQY